MKNLTVNIEGHKYQTAKTIETSKEQQISPFDEVEMGMPYRYIDPLDNIIYKNYYNDITDKGLYWTANYFNNSDYAAAVADLQELMRLLRRYAFEHNNSISIQEWSREGDPRVKYYTICYRPWMREFKVVDTRFPTIGGVFFKTYLCAKNAIHEVIEPFMEEHPNFLSV